MASFHSDQYIKVARAMRLCKPPPIFNAEHTQHYACCSALAKTFGEDNEAFNMPIFLLACGYTPTERKPR